MFGALIQLMSPVAAAEVTLATLLTDITSILTSAINWLASVAAAVVAHPLLLLFALMSFVGYGVHIYRMLTN